MTVRIWTHSRECQTSFPVVPGQRGHQPCIAIPLHTCTTLLKQPELRVIGEVSDGPEAVRQAKELQPDLILLDIGLPTLNGIEAARRIREVSPASKILFVSENRSADVAEEALSNGAGGYVVKSDAAGELLPAVKAVLEGKLFVSASLAGHFLVAATLSTSQTMLSWMVMLTSEFVDRTVDYTASPRGTCSDVKGTRAWMVVPPIGFD